MLTKIRRECVYRLAKKSHSHSESCIDHANVPERKIHHRVTDFGRLGETFDANMVAA